MPRSSGNVGASPTSLRVLWSGGALEENAGDPTQPGELLLATYDQTLWNTGGNTVDAANHRISIVNGGLYLVTMEVEVSAAAPMADPQMLQVGLGAANTEPPVSIDYLNTTVVFPAALPGLGTLPVSFRLSWHLQLYGGDFNDVLRPVARHACGTLANSTGIVGAWALTLTRLSAALA